MNPYQQCVECGSKGKEGMHRFENETLPLFDKVHSVSNLSGWRCATCNMIELDDDDITRYMKIGDALIHEQRKEQQAAQQEELKRIRKKLKLTKSDVAELLADSMNLFRLLDHHPELLKEIRPT